MAAQKFAATSPYFGRLLGAECNMQESIQLFLPAVIAAVTSGVSKELVSVYCMFWLLSRAFYIFMYALGTEGLSMLRSLSFVLSLAVSCKLFYLAAAQ